MATIPIEVIVQDKEIPVPETNTTETTAGTPDTGVGLVDNNTINGINGAFSSSASAIILPAILLTLTLITLVVLFIRKHLRHDNISTKTSRKEKLATAATSTIAILATVVLVGNLLIPATKATTDNASNIEDGITFGEDKITIVLERGGDNDGEDENKYGLEAIVESKATITSNADFGYKVLLSMAEEAETANLYLDGDTDSEYYIAPVAVEGNENTEEAEQTNIWGYSLEEDGGYSAMPLLDNAATVAQGDEPVEDESLSIYYGVKVSSDLPEGTYSGEIEYNLEASTGFPSTLTTMQGMTTEICAAAPTPGNQVTDPVPTATLIDSRDNKTYTIAKLADGKCWMTQNLDLDLKTDGTITYDSTNTNLTVAGSGAYENGYTTENGIITWTPANATIDFTGSTVEGWSDSDTAPYSANPDDVYYYTSGSDADDIQYNSLAECVAAEHTAEDCKHYHAGNYYNWSAAVASNDTSSLTTQYDNAANSICPAGWKLPKGRQNDEGSLVDNDFGTLLMDSGVLGSRVCTSNCYYEYADNGFSKIRSKPLWLVRAGSFFGDSVNRKNYGFYQTSTINSSSREYYSIFTIDSIELDGSGNRPGGYSLRCVAE